MFKLASAFQVMVDIGEK